VNHDEPAYKGLLFGEISAVTKINRFGNAHESLQQLERRGFIENDQADVLSKVWDFNPLLFDFILKRTLRLDGNSFGIAPFQSRDFFESPRKPSGA
jgi:mannonate dehydratase